MCVGDGVCERKLRGVERNRRRERARECDNASGREKEGERIVCGSVYVWECMYRRVRAYMYRLVRLYIFITSKCISTYHA